MERFLAEYFFNALWQLPLLAAGAWFLMRMTRPAPQIQYCLWLAVLGTAVLLPARGMSRAEQPIAQPDERPTLIESSHDQITARRAQPLAFMQRTHTVRLAPGYVQWLVRLYVATMVFALVRVTQAWRTSWLLASRAVVLSAHTVATASYCRSFGIKPPLVRESAEVACPMIVGILSPVLLLPRQFSVFSQQEIDAALCHELSHIKRRDPLVNLACQLAAVPLIWHPVTQLIHQRIRITREMACDAMAAQKIQSATTYARCLLTMATSMLHAPTPSHPLALFSDNTLEERIMRLTETTRWACGHE